MNLYKLRRALRFRRGDNNGHTVAHRARFTPEEEDMIMRAADKLDPDGRAPPQDVIACFAVGAAKAILAGESAATAPTTILEFGRVCRRCSGKGMLAIAPDLIKSCPDCEGIGHVAA